MSHTTPISYDHAALAVVACVVAAGSVLSLLHRLG